MRSIILFLSIVMQRIDQLIRSLLAVFVDKSIGFYARVVGFVDSQVESVCSVFAKKPCSATGGTA